MTIEEYEKYIADQLIEVNDFMDYMALFPHHNIIRMEFLEARARIKCIKDHKGNYLLSQHVRK